MIYKLLSRRIGRGLAFFIGNLWGGIRGLCGVYCAGPCFRGGAGQIAILALLWMMVRFMGDTGPAVQAYGFSIIWTGVLYPYGVLCGFGVVFLVLAGAWMPSTKRNVVPAGQVMLSFCVPLFVVALAQEILHLWFPAIFAWRWTVVCLWGWGLLAAGISLGRHLAVSALPRLAILVWVICLGGGLGLAGANDFILWAPADDGEPMAEAVADPRLLDESALYAQPVLLQAALDDVEPGIQGVPELYLVAVAGDGEQDVFLHEVENVEQLFASRFGTRTHSIVLVNNPETVRLRPIASTIALHAALLDVGRKMNREEDILFLFMTSHGASDRHFMLDLGPYEFGEVTPETLRTMLDESGVRNRIVLVSACYSGSFAEELAGPWTLAMSASRSDRSSHGCRQGADWTFFGKAYFDEALRHSGSFEQAFEEARQSVAARERSERVPASLPQIFVGKRIRAVLAAWQESVVRDVHR